MLLAKHTVETFAKENNLTRESAINKLSKLKKENFILTTGGGKQPKIYSIYNHKVRKTNGFYDLINKYNQDKLQPTFKHYTHGSYTIEHAIIDGIKIGDQRTIQATKKLFNQINNWKRLMHLAKKHKLTKQVIEIYKQARTEMKCKKIPKKYEDKND